MKFLVFVAVCCCLLFPPAHATFKQLQETCRTALGLGVCVQNDVCCTAVGGTVSGELNTTNPGGRLFGFGFDEKISSGSSSADGDEEEGASSNGVRGGRKLGFLSARAAELTAFPEALQERQAQTNLSATCSYNGVCCVLPTPTDYDCSSCGLWGDGVRRKVTTQPPVTNPPTTSTTSPPLKKIIPRIVGGTDAPRHRWCWQVGILDANGLVCGGALIARQYVLTAAHCVAGRFLDELIVTFNMYDFVHSNPNEIVYYSTFSGAKIHEDYNPATYDNDLALLRIPSAPCGEPGVCTVCLGGPVTFEPVTTPAPSSSTTTSTTPGVPTTTYTYSASFFSPLQASFDPKATLRRIASQIAGSGGGNVIVNPDGSVQVQDNPYQNLVCAITGWGSTGTSPVAPVLQEAWQQIISDQQCEADFARLGVPEEKINLPNSTFCSRGLTLTESSCVGDGGSPLVCQSHVDHGWYLYGIIIEGSNMCMPGAENGPTISLNVGNYIPWIQENVHSDLPAPDTGSGRNAYKIPGCGSNVFVADDPNRGGCPINLHAQQAAAALQGSAARALLVTRGQLAPSFRPQ